MSSDQIIFLAPPHAEELQRAIASHDLEHLRKPFSDERFYDALRRTCRRVLLERLGQPRTTHHRLSALLAELRGDAPSRADKLVVPEKGSGILHGSAWKTLTGSRRRIAASRFT